MRIARELALLRWSCHYEGPSVTLLRIVSRIAARIGWDVTSSDAFQRLVERSFDRRFGVETAGYTPPDQLPVTSEQAAEAVAYSATSSAKFGYLLARLPIEFERSTFIDIGCGKGRVLFMASEFPYRRVIGVDFAANLVEAAVGELAASGYSALTVRNVAKRAGVAPATAYTYFASKEHLIAEVYWRR
ncbi:MAG: TetR family transcriptional regulator, partial [Planctomycetales bacterium]|nr:TetR family transcriptional regulator [Planctomycetales bacterium]